MNDLVEYIMVIFFLWNIWKLRNNIIFITERFNFNKIFFRLKNMIKE